MDLQLDRERKWLKAYWPNALLVEFNVDIESKVKCGDILSIATPMIPNFISELEIIDISHFPEHLHIKCKPVINDEALETFLKEKYYGTRT